MGNASKHWLCLALRTLRLSVIRGAASRHARTAPELPSTHLKIFLLGMAATSRRSDEAERPIGSAAENCSTLASCAGAGGNSVEGLNAAVSATAAAAFHCTRAIMEATFFFSCLSPRRLTSHTMRSIQSRCRLLITVFFSVILLLVLCVLMRSNCALPERRESEQR